ncbi:hypothetical protein F5Y13DRAFT_202519 [Hypoxylon sp. FL1857]|nr:hypothetical protein F5Y13DRAFT_202519 [Hypoxylon sp. FL1857]
MGSTPKSAQSPAASPAKGKAVVAKKPSGRGVTKRTGRKPAAKKGGRGKGRGQKKVYSDPLTQAAYERQRELRDLYSQVALAIKPALDELADETIKEITEDPEAHKEAAEYFVVKDQLDSRLEEVIKQADRELQVRTELAKREYELECIRIQKSFSDSFNYQTEEFLDGALNRASIVAELRQEGRALDTPDLTYSYVDHIPYVSFLGQSDESEAAALGQGRKAKSVTKRKAEGQPDGGADSKKPRHTGGLLASEQQPDGVPESNAPSPTPLEEQDAGPVSSRDLPDLPNGASEPDDHGVRSVNRRAKSPANRFIVPPLFQFDDNEIGFRDSTNDSTRKATRATRGRFVDSPNSSTWHWDHTVKDYDLREYSDDTLDPDTVRKHGLHPRYGFFLPTSTNEAEQPGERVDGTRPVVVVPDSSTTAHASRSVRPKKMDLMLQEDATKGKVATMLNTFCENEDMDPEDIISNEMRDRERQARERLAIPPDHDEDATEELDHPQPAQANDSALRESAALLLQAAEELDKPVPAPPSPRQSRPYDAVRDVFTSAEPAPPRFEQQLEPATNGLDVLADMAEEVYRRDAEAAMSMIDPALLGPMNQPPPPPNTFLQTALNPTMSFAPIPPPPPPPPTSTLEAGHQAGPHRIPFTSQGSARDSPVLPPLRPNRSESLGKASNIPPPQQPLPPTHRAQEFGSPRGLVHTNSGTFYPPAPSRPYHQGLSFHDPHMMPVPLQQGQPISGLGMMPSQPLPHHMTAYPPLTSPPLQGQVNLAPLPPQMDPPLPSVSPPGPPVMAPSPPANTPRQRNSVSSNGNGSGGKYRKIAAAPSSNSRTWPSNGGTELRLAHYDHKEAIKDYRANEPPPRSGPTTIRGWNVNNVSKGRNRNVKKEDSEEKDSPK